MTPLTVENLCGREFPGTYELFAVIYHTPGPLGHFTADLCRRSNGHTWYQYDGALVDGHQANAILHPCMSNVTTRASLLWYERMD